MDQPSKNPTGFRDSHLSWSSWSWVRALVALNQIELSVAGVQVRWEHGPCGGKERCPGQRCPHGDLSSSACSISGVLPHPSLLYPSLLWGLSLSLSLSLPSPQLSPFYLVLSPSLPLGPLEGSNSQSRPSVHPPSLCQCSASGGEVGVGWVGWGRNTTLRREGSRETQ